MRVTAIFNVIFLFAVSVTLGQDNTFTPMKGSATPEFETADANGRCLVFGRNIVKTIQSEDGGESVTIWHREGTAKGVTACELRARAYATIKDSDNNSFFGISANYFFIDTGTSAGSRSLHVYKTGTSDKVTEVDYYANATDPRIEAARYLFYDALSNKKGTRCPDAAKWRKQGGGVAWLQGKKMDLDTQTTINVGPLRCAYQE